MLDITKPIWPDGIPSFRLGWKHGGLGGNVLRSKPERGPAKTRRTCSAVVETFSGSLDMKASQYRTFIEWFHNEIADGALEFQWWNFLTENWCFVRITSLEPQASETVPGNMDVAMTLEVLP